MSLLPENLHDYLASFTLEETEAERESEKRGNQPRPSPTAISTLRIEGHAVPLYTNQFWTAKQRDASPIHEVSYRACFKPQLPRFFIDLVTEAEDLVYDPFAGRGTTAIEAAIRRRQPIANDINPLSRVLCLPRMELPELGDVEARLRVIPIDQEARADIDLSMFYHRETEAELVSLRSYFREREETETIDSTDRWISMVATNRLTGHSPGFFSVYTLPPNQAASQRRQLIINERRNQVPDYRDVRALILRKSKQLLKSLSVADRANLRWAAGSCLFLTNDARSTPDIRSGSVSLTVTSPPFLNVVQYDSDNWLRCWFNRIDAKKVSSEITQTGSLKQWTSVMGQVFVELYRISKDGGYVAFEVGEVKKGSLNLDEVVIPLGVEAGFVCCGVLVNQQDFTKTANIWGVSNNSAGTNTNRIVILRKEH